MWVRVWVSGNGSAVCGDQESEEVEETDALLPETRSTEEQNGKLGGKLGLNIRGTRAKEEGF